MGRNKSKVTHKKNILPPSKRTLESSTTTKDIVCSESESADERDEGVAGKLEEIIKELRALRGKFENDKAEIGSFRGDIKEVKKENPNYSDTN